MISAATNSPRWNVTQRYTLTAPARGLFFCHEHDFNVVKTGVKLRSKRARHINIPLRAFRAILGANSRPGRHTRGGYMAAVTELSQPSLLPTEQKGCFAFLAVIDPAEGATQKPPPNGSGSARNVRYENEYLGYSDYTTKTAIMQNRA